MVERKPKRLSYILFDSRHNRCEIDPSFIEIGPTVIAKKERDLPEGEEALEATPEEPEEPPTIDAPAEPPASTDDLERVAGGRVVVIGTTGFITNNTALVGQNIDLFLNSVAWLVGEEDQISIRANESAKGSLTMNLVQTFLVWLIALFVVPPLCIVGAFSTWVWRRQR